MYWNIGKRIVEYQKGEGRAKYGDRLIERLSIELTKEYGGGFDKTNLRRMRCFYECFPIRDSVRLELNWTHYRYIMRVDSLKGRDYYINEVITRQLSVRELERLIKTNTYEREKSNQITYEDNKKNIDVSILKEPYILDFLGLKLNYKEKDLEQSIIDNMSKFLLELGKGYLFHSRQKKLKIDNKTYYVDLVFYNSILRCYVLIDLKINELKHNALSQMDLYCNYFDENIKTYEENKTIGLILVKENNEIVIKYSSVIRNQSIYISKYLDYLPSKEEILMIIKKENKNDLELNKIGNQ
jgi:predicted nuclease of restriction endonuclease-like (RecB) superfamily